LVLFFKKELLPLRLPFLAALYYGTAVVAQSDFGLAFANPLAAAWVSETTPLGSPVTRQTL
jgi:hypothetical protein